MVECTSIDGGDVMWGSKISWNIGLFSPVFVLA